MSVFDLRTYDLVPGKVPEFLELFEAEGLPLLSRHMGEPLGYFVTHVGDKHQLVHLWRYDSIGQMAQRWMQRNTDPAWPEYQRKASPMLLAQSSKLLTATPFSQIQ